MDSDSLFMTMSKRLPVPSPGKFFAVSTHNNPGERVLEEVDYMNAGHLSFAAGELSIDFLKEVWALCPSPWTVSQDVSNETVQPGPPSYARLSASVDHEEQSAIIFVLGGMKPQCRGFMGGSPAWDHECLLLNSTSLYDIHPASVMNQNVEQFHTGDLVLHFWGWVCGPTLNALLSPSWHLKFGAGGYNVSTRMKMLKKAMPHETATVINASRDSCELQDHDKAYLMMTIDSQVGSADTV
eukprot:6633422-Prymnesium_polylepis.1